MLFLSTVNAILAGIPPLVLMAPILLASAPFWLPYQNFWLAMSEGLTSGEAFTYAIAVLMSVVVSTGYWKLAGVI